MWDMIVSVSEYCLSFYFLYVSIYVHEIPKQIHSCLTIFIPANFKHISHGIFLKSVLFVFW